MVHFSLFFVNNIFTTKKRSGFLNMELRGCFSPKSSDFWYFKMMKRGEKKKKREGGRFLKKKNEEPHLSDWDVMGFKWPESLLTRKRASERERERPHTGDRCSRHQAMLRKKDRGSLINNKEKLPSRYRTWLLSFGRWWPQSCRRRRRESHKERHGNNKSIHARDDEKR